MENNNLKRTRTRLVCASIFFILLMFSFPLSCYATTNLQFSEDQIESVLDYFNNSDHYGFCNTYKTPNMAISKVTDFFNNVSASTLTSEINNQINQIKENIDFDVDISNTFITLVMYEDNNYNVYRYTFNIFIPNSNNYDFASLRSGSVSNYNYYIIDVTNCYKINVQCDLNKNTNAITYESVVFGSLNTSTSFYKQNENLQINNNEITLNFLVAFSDLMQVTYDYNNYFITNIIEQEQSYIEPQTISENGYRIWSGDAIQIKLNDNNKLLNNYFFVGDNLTYKNEYYYYNQSGDKINTRGLIEEIKGRYPQGGDSKGYIIQPSAQWVRYYDFYPNEIYENLTIYYYSGDELLEEIKAIENKKVIEWLISNNQIITGTTGQITNSSGDIIGNYSGDNDETNLIGYLTQQPNLENKTISSGDITNALDFDLETDPYSNMWLTITNGLKQSLLTSVRSIEIQFKGRMYIISLDNYTIQLPTALKVFLGTISTVFVVFQLFKWIKESIDKISSGDIDSLLKDNQEEGITNLF